ncbi:LemA family protein [Psychromonas algicola]|uniref:LemA family protein n=1 Tax=Psychromonas algicola TaxID=2555642 RepID=UPI00106898C5|nr:LemA family protein [Psychromonas sp. RZ5]TEW43618.1 LemA family protein [Psychromonas sp. RZ5]
MITFIILAVVLVILILMYNSLVSKKNQVTNIFSNVDVQLKKRFDLIPNLVSSVQVYMKHEKSILEELTKLRTDSNRSNLSDNDKIALDRKVAKALGSIMVAVENYPDLKANVNVLDLQHSLNEVEAQISAARRAYNQAITNYNNALEMFPTNLMAKAMNYKIKDVFEIDETQRENINIKSLFEK